MLTWTVNLNPNRLCPDLTLPRLEEGAAAAFRQVERLGAQGLRVDLFWHWLEPAPGETNQAALRWYQAFFAEAARRDLTIYALLYHPPAWAMRLLEHDEPAFLAAWERFCRLAREAFGGHVRLVQVWNEPNNFLGGLKGDPGLFHEWGLGRFRLPVGVRFETLARLFEIARATLAPETLLIYNVLANLSPFLPVAGTWLDWEHFTDRFLALASDAVDVIALDHYPDTWAPGTGPLDWECLAHAQRRVNQPGTPWSGKTVIIGEVGYSCAPNFHLLDRPIKLGRFFPRERDEASMAEWYAQAMSHLAEALTPAQFPHNRLQLVNLYELFDAPRPVGSHPALALEDHFGLLRRDGSPKPAFDVVQAVIAGQRFAPLADIQHRPPLYWRIACRARALQRRWAGGPEVLERVVPASPAAAAEQSQSA